MHKSYSRPAKTYEKKINLKLNYDLKRLDVADRFEALRIKELYDADNIHDVVKRKMEKCKKNIEDQNAKLNKIKESKLKIQKEKTEKRNHKRMINTYVERIRYNYSKML